MSLDDEIDFSTMDFGATDDDDLAARMGAPEDDGDATDENDAGTDDGATDDDAGDATDADGKADDTPVDDEGTDAEDDAADDTDDVEPEPEPEPKPKKGPRIPKERLDQALRKQRAAEQRAADIEAELRQLKADMEAASAPKRLSSDEVRAKLAEVNELLLAGDAAKAAELQAEVFAAMAPVDAPKVAAPERDLVAEVEGRIAFRNALEDAYARFPELDENSEYFDEEAASDSVALQRSYMERGYSMAEATKRAAEQVARANGLQDRKAPAAPKANPVAEKQRAAKTAAKVDKATKAPPKVSGPRDSNDEPAVDINELSAEEFGALPKAVQNRLLGISA